MTALCEHTTEIMSIGGELGQSSIRNLFCRSVDRMGQQDQDKNVLCSEFT